MYAWKEAKIELNEQKSLQPLKWSDALALAAQDHCEDIGEKGVFGHEGSDGSKVWDRMRRYGDTADNMGESLSFGKSRGTEYMTALFIDDGVANRGHRLSLQFKDYYLTGLAYCSHKSSYHGMVAIAYADDFKVNEKGKREIQKRFRSRREGSNVDWRTVRAVSKTSFSTSVQSS